ncbi:acyl-CoA dehydrogenase [Marmoricola sp. URHB0036]|uniref:acyl-CoA dehydrogenase n=1 Tax=Marmoricola sp. URHB0036 TaxID=1298863 RepID=UPI0004150B3B|nr:acyl-CoA dehydrogenase [Marmoricola sp. URHB0036]
MSDDVSVEIRSVLTDVLDKGPEEIEASWAACAEAGLLGLAVPESHGGEGLGVAEVSVLVREVGARAGDLPVRETLCCGLLTLVRSGTPEQQETFLPQIAAGKLLVAPALNEPGRALPQRPSTRLDGDRLTGRKVAVPTFAELSGVPSLLIVSATDAGGTPVVVLLDPQSEGVSRTTTPSSRGREVEATYQFDGAPVLGVLAEGAADVLREHAIAGLLAQGDGLVAGARDLTAGYIKERTQFGRRLAEFQGVAIQMAEVYVASRMVTLAAEEAVRRVGEQQPAGDDLAIGSYWFCDRAPTALQTCQHLHGGMGVDETYPLHRYFARVKDVARLLGGVEATLAAVPARESEEAKNLELTAEQQAFKDEVRSYFSGLVGPEDRLEMMSDRHGEAYHRIIRQMGEDKWMGVGWPVEYGGKGLGGIEQQIFANEAARGDVHLPAVTLQTVGPTLQAFGTEKQKDLFLERILAGDVHFAIGYSEADAGTDLASLRTTAKRDGDHYVVNGQKMWTTGGHAADYIWLAVRTDPDAPKHKGISVLIVDTKDPGYSWTPIITSDGSHHVNATYYNDVRVPVDMLVGEENEGWRLITTQLNHERVMLGPAGRLEGLRDLVAEWAEGRTDPDGTPLLEIGWVRDTLARTTAAFRVNELLNWQVAGTGATGREAVADASASKVFASDEVQVLGLALERVVTAYGDPADPETALLMHYLDATSKRNLVLTFGGGVNEVQSELISMFGLGLPKVPR